MILRVYRARAASGDRLLILGHLRDRVYPQTVRKPGLRTFQAGLREIDEGMLELALVSTWNDFGDLLRGLGPDLLRPSWLEAAQAHLTPVSADHYELVGEELTGIVPLSGARIQVLEGSVVDPGQPFFDFARRAQSHDLDSTQLVVSHIGRRLRDDGGEDAVYVTVWSDEPPAAPAGWTSHFLRSSSSLFDAVSEVPPKVDARPALLLADDDRRFVFVSPGAAELLGWAPARLLGRHVEDLASPAIRGGVDAMWTDFLRDGAQRGPFELLLHDGSLLSVTFHARANTPWPGIHASVLDKPGREIDLDEVLASSGIVARYAVAPAG